MYFSHFRGFKVFFFLILEVLGVFGNFKSFEGILVIINFFGGIMVFWRLCGVFLSF